MRKLHALLLVGGLTVFMTAWGCDDEPENGGNDAGAVVDDGDVNGSDANNDHDTGPACDPTSEAGAGACVNGCDMIGVAREDYGPADNQNITDFTKAIGISCLGDADRVSCMQTNLAAGVGDALSTDCQNCFVATVACTFEHCLSECSADADGEACTNCRCTNDCVSDWETCTGLPRVTTCPS